MARDKGKIYCPACGAFDNVATHRFTVVHKFDGKACRSQLLCFTHANRINAMMGNADCAPHMIPSTGRITVA